MCCIFVARATIMNTLIINSTVILLRWSIVHCVLLPRPQFLILDDLDRLGDTFADLLSLLDYRGPDHSQWMDIV